MIKTRRLLVALGALVSASPALASDALPQFTIAYFNGSCPEGWDNSSLGDADGRFLVPTMPGGGVGSFAGKVLASQQEPTHEHRKASGSISTSSKQFILVGGCCNNSLASAGTHAMTGAAAPASDNLPYIQYNVCMKLTLPVTTAEVPTGLSTFYMLPTCPRGWNTVNAAAGRYIVGLHTTGIPGATYGGKPLAPGETRVHSHAMDGTMNLAAHKIAGASGCCAKNYAGSGDVNFTGKTEVDGTSAYDSVAQAPYYTGTFCRKE